MKQYSKAEQSYTEALSIYREISQGADSVDTANTLYNLGNNYILTGDKIKGEEKLKEALNIYVSQYPGNDKIEIIQSNLRKLNWKLKWILRSLKCLDFKYPHQ